jgi:hypothetical protein
MSDITDRRAQEEIDRIADQIEHVAEADRLTALAKSSDPSMGRIERSMYLTEANNHLLRALLIRLMTPLTGH